MAEHGGPWEEQKYPMREVRAGVYSRTLLAATGNDGSLGSISVIRLTCWGIRAGISATIPLTSARSGQRNLTEAGEPHYLGQKNIQHTVRYTELAPDRFKNFCKD